MSVLPGEEIIRKVGRGVVGFFSLHLLSPVSDHTFEHPLDKPLELPLDWSKKYGN